MVYDMSNRESKRQSKKPWQRNLVAKNDYNKGGVHGVMSSKEIRREAKIKLNRDIMLDINQDPM